jgi:hypothetical protein
MSLYTQYLAILEMAGTPPNEAATCRWIIDPILMDLLGYGRTEWVPEGVDGAGTKPDYTILPNTPHTWFLEAKSQGVSLTEQHVRQATPYAHQSGKRWVVLTNSVDWRVYDLELPGQPPDKLAMQASRDQPDAMESLLGALTREAVTGGRLAEAARHAALGRFLQDQLSTAESEVVRQIWSTARRQTGLAGVTRGEVLAALGVACKAPSADKPAEPATPAAEPAPVETHDGWVALNDPLLKPTNVAPVEIALPDSSPRAVKSWRLALITAIEWMVAHAPRGVPVPLAGRRGGFYICSVLEAASVKPMRTPHTITVGESTFCVETNLSATGIVALLRWLCAETGVDAAQIRFRLSA